jgi:hypothetical protein
MYCGPEYPCRVNALSILWKRTPPPLPLKNTISAETDNFIFFDLRGRFDLSTIPWNRLNMPAFRYYTLVENHMRRVHTHNGWVWVGLRWNRGGAEVKERMYDDAHTAPFAFVLDAKERGRIQVNQTACVGFTAVIMCILHTWQNKH